MLKGTLIMELNIGTNIKRLRLAKGLTQEQLTKLRENPDYFKMLQKWAK